MCTCIYNLVLLQSKGCHKNNTMDIYEQPDSKILAKATFVHPTQERYL